MPSPSLHLCATAHYLHHNHGYHHHQNLGFRLSLYSSDTQNPFPSISFVSNFFKSVPRKLVCQKKPNKSGKEGPVKVKRKKENVWSVDNELAANQKERASGRRQKGKKFIKRKRSGVGGRRVMVSGAMLMEVETVLQTNEPVIKPAWNTFASSVSGIWKGVGAVFSSITAEMEPIEIGTKSENLYDCYILSHIEVVPLSSASRVAMSQIQRKTNWVTLNPYGEEVLDGNGSKEERKGEDKETVSGSKKSYVLPKFESFDFKTKDLMEEDIMGNEPGLVLFEDGSYSRGPVDIPIGEGNGSDYYLSPTFKFEQCLVKGCHKRLRIVHTIEFSNDGSEIQILRVALYEEQWVSPANLHNLSYQEFDLKPFSRRKRTQPSDLTGSWKVFEVSATPIFGDEMVSLMEESSSSPYVYLCNETLKKRSLPENPAYFGEDEMIDMQDVTMLWLPGGVTAYVDIKKDGILCIGVGWYSDEGINLVMERDYGVDGRLKEVRSKSELKRRWSNPPPT